MNKEIFNQVVNMDLKHEGFVAAAKVAMSAVESLKNNLDFRDAAKTLQSSMEKVQNSFDRFSSSPMGSAIETVIGKFSSLEAVAFGALERIGQKALDTGVRIAKSLSVDQIAAGFSEYELKIGSVQTIKASTGESLETVNKYLAELNDYADQTIYYFSDMTASIGKFTNAGVSLEDAAAAIKGISNEAALSGANANEASRAMYNFSQALSSGAVKLIDWKSIENANMATKEFKEELIKTAEELGTVKKAEGKYISTTKDMNGKVSEAFTATSKFNDSLSSQWMTSDVLTKTLAKYADETTDLGKRAMHAAQDFTTWTQVIGAWKEAVGSGWSQTFEIIAGDFEEAKKLWTEIDGIVSPVLGRMADTRNGILEEWSDNGGRALMIETLTGALKNFFAVAETAKEVFASDFWKWAFGNQSPGKALVEFTENISTFLDKFHFNSENLLQIGEIFESISLNITDAIDTVKHFWDIITEVLDSLGAFEWVRDIFGGVSSFIDDKAVAAMERYVPVIDKITEIYGRLGGFWKGITATREGVSGLGEDTAGLSESVYNIADFFKKVKVFKDSLSSPLTGILETVNVLIDKFHEFATDNIFTPLIEHASDFASLFNGILAVAGNVWGVLQPLFSELGGFAVSLVPKIVTGIAKISGGIGQILENHAGDIGKLLSGVVSLGQAIAGRLAPFISKLGELGGSIIPKLIDGFFTLTGKIGEFLSKIAEFVQNSKLLSAIGQSFSEIAEKVKGLFDKIGRNGVEGKISLLERFSNVISNLKEKLSPVVDKVKELFDRFKEGVKGAFAGGFTSPAAGAGILAGLVVMIKTASKAITNVIESWKSNIDLKGIFTGFGDKLKGIFEPLNDYLEKLSMLKNVEIIERIAKALLMLAGALVAISLVNPSRLGESLVAMSILMTEISVMMLALSKIFNGKKALKSMISAVATMNQIGQAVLVLSASLWIISSIDGETLMRSMAALAGIMTYLIAFSAMASTLSAGKGLKELGSVLKKMASAVVVLSLALKLLGTMDWSELGVALAGMAGGLAAISLVLIALTNLSAYNPMSSAAAILVVSGALLVLSAALKVVGTMDWGELGVAAAGLGGGLIVLCGALALLGYLGPTVLIGAAAMAIASLSILGLAAALRLLASIDIQSIVASVAAIVVVLGALTAASILLTNTGGVIGLLIIAVTLGMVMKKLSKLLNKAASAFLKVAAALSIISQLSLEGKGEAAAEAMKAIAKAAGTLILKTFALTAVGAALKNLGEGFKSIMDAASGGPDTLANAVTAVEAFVNATLVAISTAVPQIIGIVLALIQGILEAIASHIGDILSLIASILVQILAALSQWAPTIGLALGVVLMRVLEGLGMAFTVIGATILAALKDLVISGVTLLLSMVQAVAEQIPGVGKIISGKIEEWKDSLNETFGDGSDFHAEGLLDVFTNELVSQKDTLVEQTKGFGKEVKDGFMSGLTGGTGSLFGGLFGGSEDGGGTDLIGSLFGGDLTGAFSEQGESLGTTFTGSFTEALGGGEGENAGLLSGFMSSLSGSESEVEATGQGYGSSFLAGFDSSFASEDGTASVGGIDSLLAAIEGSESQFTSGGESLASATQSGFDSKGQEVFNASGETAVDSFVGPIANSEEKAVPAGEKLAENAATGADSKQDAFESAANNAVDGFVQASDERQQDAYNAGARIAESYNLGLQNKMKIESPSKVMYKNGEYTVDGYINAIRDKSKEVEKAGAVTATAAKNSMSTPLSAVSDILSGEFDDAMTITPVMDLSRIQNDAGRLRGMLDDATVQLGRMDISGIMPNLGGIETKDDRTLNELKGLRKDMADFNDRLSRMQVRMDTGELVGTLADPMDKALGRKAAIRGRR